MSCAGGVGVACSEPPEDDVAATQAFWNETSGVLLEAARKLGERFDALVEDEAQEEERQTAGTPRPSRSTSAS